MRIFLEGATVAYAIVQSGGKQFRVSEGQVVRVPSITAKVGDSVKLEALLKADGSSIELGGGAVTATVVEHGRGTKIIVFKKKRRKQYKKTHGHRQNYTAVRIGAIGAEEETENLAVSSQAAESSAAEEAAHTESIGAEETSENEASSLESENSNQESE
jgi:large subunit ribosomal protein L21